MDSQDNSEDAPMTPPQLKRTLAQALETDAPPPSPASEAAPEAAPAPPPEAPNGIGIGVTTVHPMQQWLPLAFKTDESLSSPWSKPPRTSSPLNPTPQFVMLMLDLSPSMASVDPTTQTFAASAVVDLLKALPTYLANTLTVEQHQRTTFAIAAFSGTAGWVDQDHCEYQHVCHDHEAGNWVAGAAISTIDAQSVKLSDGPALEAYLAKWVAKTEKIYVPDRYEDRDHGHGTNIQAALYFAHKVAEEFCNERGGSAQVFLATDGMATTGDTEPCNIRASLDEAVFDHTRGHAVPIQFHALMMGEGPQPAVLTALMGSRGLLGYAKDPETIASGLDEIFRIPLCDGQGTMDMITFVSFEDAESGQPVSERVMTCYSQGQFAADNYTALYGARLPDKYRSSTRHGAGVGITPELAASVVLRVVCFCAPNLLHFLFVMKQAKGPLSVDDTLLTLLEDAQQVLLDTRLPLSLDRYYSPRFLSGDAEKYIQVHDPPPGSNPFDTVGRLYSTDEAKETSSGSIYRWVAGKNYLLGEINNALSNSQGYEDACVSSRRYARICESSGYRGLSARCQAVVQSSEKAAQSEADAYLARLDNNNNNNNSQTATPDGTDAHVQLRSLSSQIHGSASHRLTSVMSQTPSRC